MQWIMATIYVVALVFLAYLAVALLRAKCESFGCTGIGVGWILWIAISAIAFGIGIFTKIAAKADLKLNWILGKLLVLHASSGLVLAGVYFLHAIRTN